MVAGWSALNHERFNDRLSSTPDARIHVSGARNLAGAARLSAALSCLQRGRAALLHGRDLIISHVRSPFTTRTRRGRCYAEITHRSGSKRSETRLAFGFAQQSERDLLGCAAHRLERLRLHDGMMVSKFTRGTAGSGHCLLPLPSSASTSLLFLMPRWKFHTRNLHGTSPPRPCCRPVRCPRRRSWAASQTVPR